jgi:hypothetical protein
MSSRFYWKNQQNLLEKSAKLIEMSSKIFQKIQNLKKSLILKKKSFFS